MTASQPVHMQHACNPRDEPAPCSQAPSVKMWIKSSKWMCGDPHDTVEEAPSSDESLWDARLRVIRSLPSNIFGTRRFSAIGDGNANARADPQAWAYPASSSSVPNVILSLSLYKTIKPTVCVKRVPRISGERGYRILIST
ncbi:hypothetical protein COCC4DRAFT_80440 [Bipolaris maydis ATCC 48331]|uniref:Uncharacterized protein n=2 Tax=Cochliobolus heterostrophus TaxID=5016 RepID=M2TI44_COCH5|nr:uncharacterized protein COCC4DRAFT_80440 [Bipolaris maydis ATCC 48331]EMD86174.1 hypothetical protein COCHEDRAFT_1207211 [Bipolaris maydis C5]ENI06123.1 hypothetical protein COCC4DRAFT_80440 [Bipolaris maydis ATCC 48331]